VEIVFSKPVASESRFFSGFRADLDHHKIRGSPLLYQGQMRKGKGGFKNVKRSDE